LEEKLKIKVMNSAMMPHEGQYDCRKISKKEFCEAIQNADGLESYIGYPQNIDLIERWTGASLPLCRDNTTFEEGDQALVMRLDYRVSPGEKGRPVQESDFSFFLVTFRR